MAPPVLITYLAIVHHLKAITMINMPLNYLFLNQHWTSISLDFYGNRPRSLWCTWKRKLGRIKEVTTIVVRLKVATTSTSELYEIRLSEAGAVSSYYRIIYAPGRGNVVTTISLKLVFVTSYSLTICLLRNPWTLLNNAYNTRLWPEYITACSETCISSPLERETSNFRFR